MLALKKDGSLWAWGETSYGQLGIGASSASKPTRVLGDGVWVAMDTSFTHSLAIGQDGSLWGWGLASALGLPGSAVPQAPVQIHLDHDWVSVAAGDYYSLAVKQDGSLWSWGINDLGQCGTMPRTPTQGFTRVEGFSDWKAVFAGASYSSFALRANGEFYAWGLNASGTLGTDDLRVLTQPMRVSTGWKNLDGGEWTAVGVKTNGSLWAWGMRTNLYQVRGTDDPMDYATPQILRPGEVWIAASAGHVHNVALRADGSLWSWGENYLGELGRGTGGEGHGDVIPGRIGRGTDWRAVSVGYRHNLALKEDGSLWAWGRNTEWQLGIGRDADGNTVHDRPARVGAATRWSAVAAGMYFSAALKRDGSLWAWGASTYDTPTLIDAGRWVQISAEYRQVTAVRSDGTLWRLRAPPVVARVSIERIASGTSSWVQGVSENDSTTALKADGTIWAWGRNNVGQLGLGSYGDVAPTQIGSDTDWQALAVGRDSSHAASTFGLKRDSSLWAWGGNLYGQTGTGVFGFGGAPKRIFGAPIATSTFAAEADLVDAGEEAHFSWETNATSCAIDKGQGAVPAAGTLAATSERTARYTLTCIEATRGEQESTAFLILVNEASNGSFEAGAELPDGWTASGFTAGDVLTADFARGGRRSLQLAGSRASKTLSRVIASPGAAGAPFTLSGWSRSRALRTRGGVIALEALVHYQDGTEQLFIVPFPRNSRAWRYRQKDFVTAKDFSRIEVRVRLKRQTGRAWFDDIRLISH